MAVLVLTNNITAEKKQEEAEYDGKQNSVRVLPVLLLAFTARRKPLFAQVKSGTIHRNSYRHDWGSGAEYCSYYRYRANSKTNINL